MVIRELNVVATFDRSNFVASTILREAVLVVSGRARFNSSFYLDLTSIKLSMTARIADKPLLRNALSIKIEYRSLNNDPFNFPTITIHLN